jgi:GTP-binding protein
MLIDEAKILVIAGKGGDGLVSFHREKFVPRGGPDGGDGGKGGDVILVVSEEAHGLEEFRRKKVFKAEDGQNGMRNKKTGRDGQDLLLNVPPGTVVYEVLGNRRFFLKDLKKANERYLLARGGKGGLGNYHFATSVRQAPNFAGKGEEGERKEIELELRLIADVGLIGLPNVGKSSLLAVISAAKPKIANYPFTTLSPELGVVTHKGRRFVVADIPGLIKGAALGKGLGDDFLKHVRRTHILLHLLSVESNDLLKDYQVIRQELSAFDPGLLQKEEVVVLNKIDILEESKKVKLLSDLKKALPQRKVFAISTITREGIEKLLDELIKRLF